ncbi:hypothetical protein Gohar_003639 [Gossypium harknessii]|uniref:RNase H type-1 domain-containing protein n=1 Tax=Gossypium harknessii TaxID=34285 RepID=A0A7J9IBP6_9ROSI|nr:hypothetical protein [Gossypium harknessii]
MDPSCVICGRAEESCIHVLRDCCQAWKDLVLANLRNVFGLEYQDVMWQSLFGIICWKLWKQRNLTVFQGISFNSANIIQSLWCWVSYIKTRPSRRSAPMSNRHGNYRWSPPPTGSFKINVDDARNPSLGLASFTAIARDEYGRWLWEIERNIRRCSVEQVELWAIYDGLHLVWDFKWNEVILKTNYS